MSYILDALKKSDQERQKGSGPSLQTIHRPLRLQAESPLLKWILSLLLLLLIAFIGVGAWYLSTDDKNKKPDVINQKVEGQSSVNQASVSLVSPRVNDVQKSQSLTSANELIQKSPVEVINNSAIRFNDLDANTRAEIPSLTFSFHVYSDNPKRRTIIINSRRVREGDLVERNLLLEEITPLGVVLIWNNTVRFSIDVVESW